MSALYTEGFRFLIFAFIGVFNTLLDLAIWRTLVWLLEKKPAWISFIHTRTKMNQYAAAQIFSTLCAACFSFVLNRSIAFADTAAQTDIWQVTRFFAVTGFSMLISTICMQFLTETNWVLAKTHRYSFVDKHWPIIAKLLTVGVTMVTNFVGYRLFVF